MSDPSASMEVVASHLLVAKYILTATGALAVYDYFLTLQDEIMYVWKGRKCWTSALFIANRYLLLAYAILIEFFDSQYQYRLSNCPGDIYAVTVLVLFFFFSSDVFIFLRVFAVSGRNKFVGLYLSSLVCAKAVTSLISVAHLRPNAVPLPVLPFDEFKICTAASPFSLQLVPYAIGALFNLSAFVLILWFAYSGAANLRFSIILKTIVADATVYFIMAACVQTVVLLFLVLGDPSINEFPTNIDTVVTPTLINRLVLSLKKAADVHNNFHGVWNAGHFSDWEIPETTAPHHSAGSRVGTSHHRNIPLNSLTPQGGRAQSYA